MSSGRFQTQLRQPQSGIPGLEVIGRRPFSAASQEPPEGASGRPTRWTPWLDLAPIATGGLLIALAFAASRAGYHEGDLLYWVGQAVIILPSAYRVLSPATDTRSRLTILVGIAAMQAVLAWAYSPDQFRFGDELQHVRTARDILRTHKLFTSNPILAVSPGFPGLEEVTVALVNLTGLSVFVCGVIVASLSHVILPVALFMAYRELSVGRERWAALATLLYTTAPHYNYFETLFIYSTPALTFLGFTLAATARAIRRRRGFIWIAVAFVPMLLTHHLTTLAGLVLLLAVAIICLFAVSRQFGLRLLLTILGLVVLTVAWVEVASPETWGYLATPVTTAVSGLFGHSASSGGGAAIAASPAPRWETAVEYLSALVLLLLSYFGVALAWFARAPRWVRFTSLLGLIFPGILLVRLTSGNGPELATRGLTYAMLVIALPSALAIEFILARRWSRGPRARRGRYAGGILAFGIVSVLVLSAIVEGLPPSYERLPGHFYVASTESGVDSRVSAVGAWAAQAWPDRSLNVACDVSVCSEWAALTEATATTSASPLFYTTSVAKANKVIAALSLGYVETDLRWTTQIPKTQQYFDVDTRANHHAHPLPLDLLTKFDRDSLLERVYDDGDIRVYRTYAVWRG